MLLTPSLCHKLSHLLGPPPPSSVTYMYFMDGPQRLLWFIGNLQYYNLGGIKAIYTSLTEYQYIVTYETTQFSMSQLI